jgi:hypothetical protein
MAQEPPLAACPADRAAMPSRHVCAAAAAKDSPQAVLLYYCYLQLTPALADDLAAWMQAECRTRGLRGRVRVAEDGLNVTVRGGAAGARLGPAGPARAACASPDNVSVEP